jgi:chaperone modulatory protein CbpM
MAKKREFDTKELMIISHYTRETFLSLDQVCHICDISPEFIDELIDQNIIHPHENVSAQFMFSLSQLRRIKTAKRLQKDLEINLAGVALILELLEEMAKLREKASLLDKYFL